MYGACHINGTWGSKEVWRLKLYEDGKPLSQGPSFLGVVDISRHHFLKRKANHFLEISIHSTRE